MANAMGRRVRDELGRGHTRDWMVRTARRVVGASESEDVAHDAVVQALAASDRFRADARVSTWLHRIAFNAALMSHRHGVRATRRIAVAGRAGDDVPWLGRGQTEPAAVRELEAAQDRRRLRRAVAQLPDGYREVIERCVYDEEGPDQVASRLGITPSAVRTRFFRAQDRLRKLMQPRALGEAG